MSFYQYLQQATAAEREYLLSAPVIAACQRGEVSLGLYRAFLAQAYHHVSHTVPLLMAAGARMPASHEWVRQALVEYIAEEYGHQEWILNDLRACGGDAEAVRQGRPGQAIELMVAFLYHQIDRHNPTALFGMVQVLEGTSVAIALTVAGQLRQELKLPEQAMSYLSSHGTLDQEHLRFFAGLMDRVTAAEDQEAIVHAARVVYRLYGDMLRSLEVADGAE